MFIFAPRENMQNPTPSTPSSSRRNNRYTRSSTTSVTQLLSDSCTNLLQRLTNRVRGPSAFNDWASSLARPRREDTVVNNTRSRLEAKYSSVIERKPSITSKTRQRGERNSSPFVREERTLEPSQRRSVLKNPPNILLSEKAYPYVSTTREKTPARQTSSRSLHRKTDNRTGCSALSKQPNIGNDSCRRYERHKSGHMESRTRKVKPRPRHGKSEEHDGVSSNLFSDRRFNAESTVDPDKTPTAEDSGDKQTDPAIIEREAKRKEIQSLIMKYAALDDICEKSSAADAIASKYHKRANVNNNDEISAKKGSTKGTAKSNIVSCRAPL